MACMHAGETNFTVGLLLIPPGVAVFGRGNEATQRNASVFWEENSAERAAPAGQGQGQGLGTGTRYFVCGNPCHTSW